jgi:hypothetical protein
MENDRLFARIRRDDDLIKEHFETVKRGDRAYEIRRLLEKAIKIERKEKESLKQYR